MRPRLAVQLYTVREALAEDVEGSLRRLAEMGYEGVESFGPYNERLCTEPALLADLGLELCSVHHMPPPRGDAGRRAVELVARAGCRRLVTGLFGPDFAGETTLRRACDQVNESVALAREAGLSTGLHNHWWEFEPLPDGPMADEILLDALDPDLFFEVDVYWARTAGRDPAAVVERLGARVPLLHLKDGPAVLDAPQVALGDGVIDLPAVVRAARHADWFIAELDHCATDMFDALARSRDYLGEINRPEA